MKKIIPFLAVAFSGFLVYIFDKVWGNSIEWAKVKTFNVGTLLNTDISFKVYHLLLFLIFIGVIYLVKSRFKEKPFYSGKQQKLRKYDEQIDNENEILFRWTVFFDYNTPFIADLEAFCLKHNDPPIRFVGGRCPHFGCQNGRDRINDYLVKNQIESVLIDRWRKMK
jgi:hypothetical protein